MLNSGKTTETGTPLGQHPPLATALSDLASRKTPAGKNPVPKRPPTTCNRWSCWSACSARSMSPVRPCRSSTDRFRAARKPRALRQAGLQALASVGKKGDRPRGAHRRVQPGLPHRRNSFGKEPDLRRDATVALGTFSSETAVDRLDSLLGDSDEIVRYNAAVSLVRRGRKAGAVGLS
ncbi:MAG: hypothetical protein Ct9H300mP1_10010 [Planctomycetaceae bacterium]|nr:MAG: hypothetical protein Ct9H300mP1_10010 [Planctomycetaceae bacterium]